MRIAKKEEKSAVIKIHERHIASVVVVVVGVMVRLGGRGWTVDGDSAGMVGARELG